MSADQQGPSEETFRVMAQKLPQFVAKALGPQLSLPAGTNYRRPCKICQKHFGNPHRPTKRECCKGCLKQLEEGWCAITCIDGRADWARGEPIVQPEWVGTVQNLTVDGFEYYLRLARLAEFIKRKASQ